MAVRLLIAAEVFQHRGQRLGRHPAGRRHQAGDLDEPAGDVAAVVDEHAFRLERHVGAQEGGRTVRVLAQPFRTPAIRLANRPAELNFASVGQLPAWLGCGHRDDATQQADA